MLERLDTGCHLFLGLVYGVRSLGRPIPCSDAVDCKDISTLCCELGESDAGKEDRNMPKQMTSAVPV